MFTVQSKAQDVAVSVDIPWQAVGTTPPDPARLSRELRVLWVIDQVRQHRVGIGKGAELAQLPRAAFMELLGEHGAPVIDYPVAELQDNPLAGPRVIVVPRIVYDEVEVAGAGLPGATVLAAAGEEDS